MLIFVLIMLFLLGWQLPPQIEKRNYKEAAVFLAFWGGSAVYGYLVLANIAIPSPFELIIYGIEYIYTFLNI